MTVAGQRQRVHVQWHGLARQCDHLLSRARLSLGTGPAVSSQRRTIRATGAAARRGPRASPLSTRNALRGSVRQTASTGERRMSESVASNPPVGIGVVGDAPAARLTELIARIDALGFDGVWIADERFYRDTYPLLTLAALTSPRLRIGCAVTDPYSRHPAITAAAMATVDEIAGGRCRIGIGAGAAGLPSMGIARTRPAAHLREAIRLVRALLRGEQVDVDGETVTFHGRLNFTPRPDIPIIVAGRGPAMLEIGGELADAVMIGTFAAESGIRYAQERIARGAIRAGRDPATIPLISWLYVAIDADRRAARERVKRGLATAIFGSRGVFATIGIHLPPALITVLEQTDYDALADPTVLRRVMDLIPDDLVAQLAVAGTVDDVAQQLAAIVRLGIGELAIWPFPPQRTDLEHEIAPLAEEVLPRMQWALRRGSV
jgi:5,10-methylenetetrahydromethanopterin reductase